MKSSLYLFLLLCAFASVGCQGTKAQDAKPNIVFIFADDWGWGDLSAHGSTFCQTPNLDGLATQGIDFDGFTVNNPVCSPSRTAIMTGHYPARHSVHQHFATIEHHVKSGMPDWLDPQSVMLPRLLQQAGYATAHYGKWHLSNTMVKDAPLPGEYGFDDAAVFNGPGKQISANPNSGEPLPSDAAIEFIRANQDQPFFINLWVHATHTPHYPVKKWMDHFAHLDEQQQVYAAIVAETDERIGQVLAVLDELKLADNTIVIFSSDNGPENTGTRREQDDLSTGRGLSTYYSVGETGGLRGRKRSLFDGGVGVPFIVRWPGQTPAGVIDRSTVLTGVDLLPTFCAAAGVELPEGYVSDGSNMLAAFKGTPTRRSKPIYWDWRGASYKDNWPRLGVQDGKWRLLMTLDRSRVELFDMTADRAQSTNLADQYPQVVERLAEAALAWRASLPTEAPKRAFSKNR